MRHRAVGPRPSRQPGVVGTTDQHQDWRTAQDLVLELTTQPHSSRHRLAVQDRQVDTAGIHRGDHCGLGRHLEYSYRRQIGCHLAPQG
jgi:hypothetical protein